MKKILIADDSKTTRQVLNFALTDAGFAVTEAVDGMDRGRRDDAALHRLRGPRRSQGVDPLARLVARTCEGHRRPSRPSTPRPRRDPSRATPLRQRCLPDRLLPTRRPDRLPHRRHINDDEPPTTSPDNTPSNHQHHEHHRHGQHDRHRPTLPHLQLLKEHPHDRTNHPQPQINNP